MMRTRLCVAAAFMGITGSGCASESGEWRSNDSADDVVVDIDNIEELRARNDAHVAELIAEVRAFESEHPEEFKQISEAWKQSVSGEDLVQEQRVAVLKPEERELIETNFAADGIDLSAIAFTGRLIAMEDVLIDADTVLTSIRRRSSDAVEDKASTFAQTFGGVQDDIPQAATLSSRCTNTAIPVGRVCPTGGSVQYFRPEVTRTHYVIVPNNNNTVKDIAIQSLAELTNITNDCITNTFAVVTESEYLNNVGAGGAFAHEIYVKVGTPANVCSSSGSPRACATLPTFMAVTINGAIVQRMALGVHMGLNSTIFNVNDDNTRGTFMHEVGHTMGISHPPNELGGGSSGLQLMVKLYVPGTSQSTTVSSIMQSFGGTGRVQHPSNDDIATIRKLFPSGCSYVHDWSTIP